MTIQMKAIEKIFHVVLFVFDTFKIKFKIFPSVLSLALLEVKGSGNGKHFGRVSTRVSLVERD